ncbi:MAG: LLM class F420-dependent oxidoreductase [Myxococcota bacterium]
MRFGVVSYNTDYGIRPDDCARAAEARGFDSIWFPDHTHIPTSRATPFALGGELPRQYKHFMDPFVSMMAAAAATSQIKLGTGVCLLIERDPIVVAKAIATLDVLSRGRVLVGDGGGWNREEMANHGTRFEDRWRVLRERVAAIKAIWTQDEASYHGEFVNFDPIWCYPKPVQRPHPPIFLGAVSGAGLKRVVDYCDGWLLVDPRDGALQRARVELRKRAEEAGRDPDSIPITVFALELSPQVLDEYAAASVTRVAQLLPPDTHDEAMKAMDESSRFVERYA